MLYQQANSDTHFMAIDQIFNEDQPPVVQHVTAKIYENAIVLAASLDLFSTDVRYIKLSPELICEIALKWNAIHGQSLKEETLPEEPTIDDTIDHYTNPSRIVVDEESIEALAKIDDETVERLHHTLSEVDIEDQDVNLPAISELPEERKPYNPSFRLSATKMTEVLKGAANSVVDHVSSSTKWPSSNGNG